jgi:quinol monooxygenase YgiN
LLYKSFTQSGLKEAPIILSMERLVIPLKKVRDVKEFLQSMAQQTSIEPGCSHCRVYQDAKKDEILLTEERWRDKEDLNRHLRSNEFRKLLLISFKNALISHKVITIPASINLRMSRIFTKIECECH